MVEGKHTHAGGQSHHSEHAHKDGEKQIPLEKKHDHKPVEHTHEHAHEHYAGHAGHNHSHAEDHLCDK